MRNNGVQNTVLRNSVGMKLKSVSTRFVGSAEPTKRVEG